MGNLCLCSDGVDGRQAKSVVGCIYKFSPACPKQHRCHIDLLLGVPSNLEKTGTSFTNGLRDSRTASSLASINAYQLIDSRALVGKNGGHKTIIDVEMFLSDCEISR